MAKNGALTMKNPPVAGNGYIIDDGRNYLGTKDANTLHPYKHHIAPNKERSNSMSLRIKPSKGLLEDAQKRILLKEYNSGELR